MADSKKESKKGKKAAPKDETKAQKFERMAVMRVSKALHTIKLLGNLSGNNYQYTQEQVNKMFTAIQEATKETYARFQPKREGEKKKSEFSF